MNLKKTIQDLSASYLKEIIQIRRHLHQYPELSFQESETQKYLLSELKKTGLEAQKIAETGIVALIPGKSKGKCIALRADMDALPLQEKNTFSYKSVHPEIMHACGHDAHMAMLLGAAKIVQKLHDQYDGCIKLIFQPAEEKLPGGALKMIKNGVLKNPDVDLIIAQHVEPHLQTGKAGFKAGKYMASTDEIFINIKGSGGHAAMPEKIQDSVYLSALLLVNLQQIVSRKAKPSMPSVLSFGKIIAKGATNIIPDKVYLEGTMRTFDEKWRQEMYALIEIITKNTLEPHGLSFDLEIRKGYPVLINDTKSTNEAIQNAKIYLGNENVLDLDFRMTAEDFSYYAHEIPAVFYRLGTGNENKKSNISLHNASFDIDEEALKNGMGLLAWLALSALKNQY
jgi:amidohydrolase